MTLFADVLSVGLATAAACLPLLTAPAAVSTACAVLRGAREDRPATAGRYFALLRRRLWVGDLMAGAAALAGALLFAVDLALAGAGLPGAPLFAVTAAGIGACVTLVALRARARPESLDHWPTALREAARDAVRDLGGSGLVLLVAATAGVCAWVLVPLAFLAPGPPALALTAVDVRCAAVAGREGSAPGG
ncbi:hypothetical protein GCM10022403_052620 [Streptomyces coacervatus]|uniref:Integral membrane protein n=1 Tax=Streptomyces coacervatus TaxID=647381 RepID=A0ABP7I8P6_9ACTN|nr:hypothetical protein [Streptomyces coacervatus]MDF2273350.1 hypothetical protein [Streptomyces coacervatus]